MSRHLVRVLAVTVVGPATLAVRFDDGLERTVDLGPVLRGPLFGLLTDPAEFAQVTVDPECGVPVWPCGVDFDPATLHDWPTAGPAMAEMAASW